jgi:hypothetical protein
VKSKALFDIRALCGLDNPKNNPPYFTPYTLLPRLHRLKIQYRYGLICHLPAYVGRLALQLFGCLPKNQGTPIVRIAWLSKLPFYRSAPVLKKHDIQLYSGRAHFCKVAQLPRQFSSLASSPPLPVIKEPSHCLPDS